MNFIRLLLANQIDYIFLSNDNLKQLFCKKQFNILLGLQNMIIKNNIETEWSESHPIYREKKYGYFYTIVKNKNKIEN